MHVDAAIAVHQVAHQDEALVDHRDERIRAAPPSVAVGDLFEEVRLLVKRLAADLDVHAEVGAHVERRVDVDQLQAAGVLDLPAQRAALERRENQLVVAPDELVGPALQLAAASVEAAVRLRRRPFPRAARRCARASETAARRCRPRASCRSRPARPRACPRKQETVLLRQRLALLMSLMRSRFSASESS